MTFIVTKDQRIGHIICLLGAAVIAVLGFWYPEFVADKNAAPDDRFGLVLVMGIPFEIIGAIIAVYATFGLFMLTRHQQTRSNWFYFGFGLLLMVFSLTPLIIIGRRLSH